MKRRGDWLAMMVGVVMVGIMGCGQEASKTSAPSAPAAPSKSATESTGQAVVDSIKTPLDKARQVEGTLENAAGKTADTVKDATP
jgi:hypothetical protein